MRGPLSARRQRSRFRFPPPADGSWPSIAVHPDTDEVLLAHADLGAWAYRPREGAERLVSVRQLAAAVYTPDGSAFVGLDGGDALRIIRFGDDGPIQECLLQCAVASEICEVQRDLEGHYLNGVLRLCAAGCQADPPRFAGLVALPCDEAVSGLLEEVPQLQGLCAP